MERAGTPMHEYVYVWDRKSGRCVAVWHVVLQGAEDAKPPVKTTGAIPEGDIDMRIKALLAKYPEPRYLVDGGESEEPDGMKAAALLFEQACRDEEEWGPGGPVHVDCRAHGIGL